LEFELHHIHAFFGDITERRVDAIVNPANVTLLGGGGVDGAIHRVAGPDLLAACREIPEVTPGVRCPIGHARITPAFRLHAKHVIHAVGPVYRDGMSNEPKLLANCYRNSLALAANHDVESIAFPAISCGVFGFPTVKAARIAVHTICEFLSTQHCSIAQVDLVSFDEDTQLIFLHAIEAKLGEIR
jgi:O-acetyl-ADP-ribose deacetylase